MQAKNQDSIPSSQHIELLHSRTYLIVDLFIVWHLRWRLGLGLRFVEVEEIEKVVEAEIEVVLEVVIAEMVAGSSGAC